MLETTTAGSLPKPAWLAAPRQLWAPWQLEGEALREGKRDATLLAVKMQEDAGIDIANKVRMGIRNNRYEAMVPTVTAPLRRRAAVHAGEAAVARAHTKRRL